MLKRRIAARLIAVALAIGAAVPFPSAQAGDERPMRSEDVVRMLVGGAQTDELLEAIRTRPAEFDLSPELQEELRLAGVPKGVIRAMLERMAELEPEPTDPVVEGPVDAVDSAPLLRIRLAPADGDRPPQRVRVEGQVNLRLMAAWQLDPAAEGSAFEDLALYLACRSATHVPDHWRSKSPLGRDFISMPRHRLLAFVSATEQRGGDGDARGLVLELPPVLEVALEPGELHDLSLGLALQVSGRYYRWIDDVWDELVSGTDGAELRAEIRGAADGRIDALEVRFDRTFTPATDD